MIDFGQFPALSLEIPCVVTSIQCVCYLYEEYKPGSSVNELRHRMFTKKNLSGAGDRLPSTLDMLVLHLRRASIFFLKSFSSFVKNIKYNIEKTFSVHKTPLYIKQFFSYDIKNIHRMLFFQNLVLFTHLWHVM